MPTPTSISSSGRSNPGLPAAGVVHAVRATANDADCSFTCRPTAATAASSWPSAAAAPATFSTISVAPVPRRPAVQVESSTATSSSTRTVSTRQALVGGELGGHLEVQHVAGVVLDDVDDAGAAVDRLGRGQDLVGHGRGEDLARAGRVEHAGADEPAVQRLVARPAAGDQADLAGHRGVGADDDLVGEVDPQLRVGRGDPGQRLADHVLRAR